MTERIRMYLDGKAPRGQFRMQREGDAGYDIMSAEAHTLEPGERHLFATGLYLRIPEGFVGIVKSRGGLSVRHGLETGAGVVDSNYTGEVFVLLHNHGGSPYTVSAGDRIAQMCVMPVLQSPAERVDSADALGTTERGSACLGSSDALPQPVAADQAVPAGMAPVLLIDPFLRRVSREYVPRTDYIDDLYRLIGCDLVEMPEIRLETGMGFGVSAVLIVDEEGFLKPNRTWTFGGQPERFQEFAGRGILCCLGVDDVLLEPAGLTPSALEALIEWRD